MSRRTVILALVVTLILGTAGVGYIGYRYFTRDRPAIGTYRLVLPEGVTMKEVADTERAVMGTDEILKDVIQELGLIEHWGFDSEAETLAHMREKLIVRPGYEPDQLQVLYRDRSAELAQEVLLAISERYMEIKKSQQVVPPRATGPAPGVTGSGG